MDTRSQLALLVLLLIVAGVAFYNLFWPKIRLAHIQRQPFPPTWLEILRRCFPFLPKLPEEQSNRLCQLIMIFLSDKTFYGCAGQKINDDIRVTVAGQACLMLLNRDGIPYPDLKSILVYPSTFVATRDVADEHGFVSTDQIALLGESWSQGKVILAWDNVEQGVRNLHDGRNVVLHEFAHQLDHESGATNGAPVLTARGAYRSWAHVFAEEFSSLQHRAALGKQTLLDHYGATNPAEFFAVATETFFERPTDMAMHHKELFEQLRDFYGLDPGQWQETSHG
jgi:Mlc titration factor MtfA (ptsG expression regulator)